MNGQPSLHPWGVVLTQYDKIDAAELVGGGSNPDLKTLENGEMSLLLTQPRVTDRTGFMDKTYVQVMSGKYLPEEKPNSSTLGAYKERPVVIPVDIIENVVESVAWKPSGSTGPGCMNSEALQVWLLKVGDHSKNLCNSVEFFHVMTG